MGGLSPSRYSAKAWLPIAHGSGFDPLPMAHSLYPAAGVEPDAAQGHNRMSAAGRDPQFRSPQFLHISVSDVAGCKRAHAREVLTRVIPEDHDGVKRQPMEHTISTHSALVDHHWHMLLAR